jgi:two-component system LytT family response regulator
MYKTIIVDDEQPVREMLKTVLTTYCDKVSIVGSAVSVSSAFELFKSKTPDLILLDINLPDGTGFDLLEKIGNETPSVIFITAYNDYAIKAFRFSAIDYILKPINIDNLIHAIDKASESIENKNLSLKLQSFFENMNSKPEDKKIVLKTQESIHIVKVKDIIRCEADHNYTTFYAVNGKKIVVSKTLKEFDDMLIEYGFFRTHQSHLININHVNSFQKNDGGYLIMVDNSNVPVSKRKREELLKLFGNY